MAALLLRGLAQRKLRTALCGLAVLLGVAMVAGTYVQTDRIQGAFDSIERTAYTGQDVAVSAREAFSSDMGTATPFSADVLRRIAAVPGVRLAEGSLYEAGSLVVAGKRVGSSYAPGILMSDHRAPFDPLRYTAGGKPAAGQVAVNRKLAVDEHLRVGQTISVATRTGVKRARLAGIFEFGTVSSIGGATVIVAPLATVQRWYDVPGTLTGIAVAAGPGVAPAELSRRIGQVLPRDLRARTGAEEAAAQAKQVNEDIGRFLTPMLLALAGVSLLVGAFIIFNTFSITVAQRARELGLLRAIGATRRQVVASVTAEALLLGGVASTLGLGVGLAIAAGMGALMDAAGMGIPAEGVSLAPRTIVVGLLCGVLTTLLAALVPAVRGTRVAPVAAITGATTAAPGARRLAPWLAGAAVCGGVAALLAGLLSDGAATSRMTAMGSGAVLLFVGIAAGARWLVRPVASVVGRPVERLFGVAGQLARENAMRNPARTATTAAALMVGLGMVVFVAVFAAGLKASVNGSLDAVIRADYIVQARGVEPLPAGAGAAVASVPDVRATSPIAFDQVQVNGRAVQASTDTVEGIDPRTIDAVYRFRWIGAPAVSPAALRPGQALIEQQFAKAHDLRVGSMFSVRTSSGRSARLVAVGEYDDPQILQGLMVSGDQFRRLSTLRDPYLYLIASAPGASAPVMHRALDRALGAFPTAEVRSNAEYRQDVEDQLDQMANMLYALLAMSVVIAVFGIANNLFLSVYERTREIGLLRAMGATGTQVRRVIRYESVITATIGGLLGIGVGLLLAWLMVQALRDLGFGYAVPVGQLVVFLLVAIGVGVAAAVAPARRGAHIDVLQALRHE